VAAVGEAVGQGRPIAGYEADRAARRVIEAAGYGEAFVHRTGHSIDRDLHGSGPHLDDYETHDDRLLVPGVGFSVEPGIYLPGDFGIRSEVNVFWGPGGPETTPVEIQRELVVA
jgi:Xaa-Pro dipeptidase